MSNLSFIAGRIEQWPIDRLRPFDRNPRVHDPEQVTRIAGSIAEFGWLVPVLADGEGNVIAGHGRLLAAKLLGLTEAPVVVTTHLSETQRRAYVIADNQLTMSSRWDDELLAGLLHELNGRNFDLDLLGFSAEQLDDLMAPLEDESEPETSSSGGEGEEEDAPEPPSKPVSCFGDLWLLGEHRLLCGDSTDAACVARLMVGETAGLCFTSPPYGNQREYTTGGIGDWDKLMQGVFRHLPMASEGQVLVNLGLIHRDGEWQTYWERWIEWMRLQGWKRFGFYVWDQGPGLPGDWGGRFAPSHEFVFHFNKKSRKPNKTVPCKYAGQEMHLRADGSSKCMRKADGTIGPWSHSGQATQDFRIPDSVIRICRHKARGIEVEHPAVFPTALVENFMAAFTDEGDVCYEPFGGSGTSIVAAERLGRRCRAIELAPEYCDVAIRRWNKLYPERSARLDGADCHFEEIAAERQ
ncbi:Methyltransferase [Azospirillaceae bacterium]